jgi:hypothetical protein
MARRGDLGALKITEIHYNPTVQGAETADDGEFIELQNTGSTALDLSGCVFAEGITYTFPANSTVAPGGYYVIVRNPAVFAQRHPGVTPNGTFTGKLGDDGESIVLATAGGARIFALDFDDESPWPLAPDGFGPSLVYDGAGNPDDGKNWNASAAIGGSPGAPEPSAPRFPKVVVNEVLGMDPTPGATPFIELHNPGPTAADISNWQLGTDRTLPAAKIFDAGTVIPPGGFLLIRPVNGMPALDTAGGAVFLSSVPAGYAHECRYAPLEPGIASGRHINSDGEQRFVAQSPTPDATNGAPLSRSALRISEVFYAWTGNPALDFIEIENSGTANASLEGLRVVGLNFTFPAGSSLAAGERVIVTRATEAAFRAAFSSPTVPVFGPTTGDLQDNGERVAIEEPIAGSNPAAWRTLDEVRYNDRYPWPISSAGPGDALHRLPVTYGDESASWVAGIPTPGAKGVDGRPRVTLTSPQDQLIAATGGLLRLAADAVDVDGEVDKVEFFVDGRAVSEDTEAPFEAEWAALPGTHDIVARATDDLGNFADSEPVVVFGKGNEAKDAGAGLKAEYFANSTLEGTAVEGVAETINFDWSELPPATGIPRTGFSARFTGKLLPRASGSHTLVFRRAGGLRVYIGGEQILDSWDEPDLNPGETFVYNDTSIELEGGVTVEFVVEYFDTNGHGNLAFSWYEPNDFNERPVAQGQLFLPTQAVDAFGISTPSLIPTRRLGQRIKVALETSRAEGPVVWQLVEGNLPSGVSLVPSGLLSGVANTGGAFTFRLEAEDSSGAKSQRTFRMWVVGPANGTRGPVVRISSPATGSVVGKVPVTISGTVSGATPLLAMEYSLNNGNRRRMAASRNWTLVLDDLRGVIAGDNSLKIFAIDESGLEAASPEISFKYRYRSELSVTINGGGSISPGYLGTTLRYVGSKIEVTAIPAPGWVFSHWEPSFDSSPTLKTTMEENLELIANFVENPFRPFAGRYTGLVGEGRRQGRYDLTISPTGRFTMSLFVGGARQSLSGAISPRGDYNTSQDGDPALPNSTSISLRSDTAETVVTTQYFNFDNFEVFESVAVKSSWKTNCPAAGLWTLSLGSRGAEFPGTGYATMKVGRNGLTKVVGRASNGWPISASLIMDDNLRLPFYTPVGESATVAGALNYTSQRAPRIAGEVRWVGENLDSTNPAEAAPYRIPRMGFSAIFLSAGEATFVDKNASLNFTTPVALNNANRFIFSTPGTALPSMIVSPKNGLVSGSYIHSESGKRVQVRGVVNQSTNSAAGISLNDAPGGFTIAAEAN